MQLPSNVPPSPAKTRKLEAKEVALDATEVTHSNEFPIRVESANDCTNEFAGSTKDALRSEETEVNKYLTTESPVTDNAMNCVILFMNDRIDEVVLEVEPTNESNLTGVSIVGEFPEMF